MHGCAGQRVVALAANGGRFQYHGSDDLSCEYFHGQRSTQNCNVFLGKLGWKETLRVLSLAGKSPARRELCFWSCIPRSTDSMFIRGFNQPAREASAVRLLLDEVGRDVPSVT